MNKIIDELFELQKLNLRPKANSAEIEALRKKIPAQLLVNFDRALTRGKKSVAMVRSGVCSECHLQITIGVVTSLASNEEIQRCGNCGRYLYLVPGEPLVPAPAPAKPVKTRRKKELAHVP